MIASTALNALDAIVIDTETTGLDATKARLVQIGAIRLRQGRLSDASFSKLVNPGQPVPPETSAIHGITDDMLADAPDFERVYSEFEAFLGDEILIGHNLGFDIAILQREHQQAKLRWRARPMLDTRLLAEICLPRFGGYSLDKLASHFGLEAPDRHDALADARLTGELFLALVPLLRENEIRTLGNAERACRRLSGVLEGYQRIGWKEPVRAPQDSDTVLERIDSFPFRHQVKDIANTPPVFCTPETSLADAIALMCRQNVSSIFVAEGDERRADASAIVTERDVIRRLGLEGSAGLARPVGEIASRPLQTVPGDAFLYRAIGRLHRKAIRHLGVTDAGGIVIGAVSARDLLEMRSSDALSLGDAIESAHSLPELANAWSRVPRIAERLLREKVSAREIAQVISAEIGALTGHAARLAENELIARGDGPSPAPYAVLVMGSAGRGESLLIPDQDNAVIYASSADDSGAARWFAKHGQRMNQLLDEIGIPLCKGNIMAGNAGWNGPPEEWARRVLRWSEAEDPKDLLAVDIFYDFRCVWGDAPISEALRARSMRAATESRLLLKLLSDALRAWSPPLGFFGQIAVENGSIDLKKGGLFPIVAAARALALAHGIEARATPARLAALRERGVGNAEELAELDRVHALLLDLILDQQIADAKAGDALSTRVTLSRLTPTQRAELREALGLLRPIPEMVHALIL